MTANLELPLIKDCHTGSSPICANKISITMEFLYFFSLYIRAEKIGTSADRWKKREKQFGADLRRFSGHFCDKVGIKKPGL